MSISFVRPLHDKCLVIAGVLASGSASSSERGQSLRLGWSDGVMDP